MWTCDNCTTRKSAPFRVGQISNPYASYYRTPFAFRFRPANKHFALPGGHAAVLSADTTTTIYYVNDEPLLTYFGATGVQARFSPTRYAAAEAQVALREVAQQTNAGVRNRISVLLGNTYPPAMKSNAIDWC